MTNCMEEVAKLLGVELNEEFEIIFPSNPSCHATVKLTIDGTKVINTNVYDCFNFKSYLLEHLIKGAYDIKRKPWKPEDDELYFYVDENGIIWNKVWDDSFTSDHMNYYKLGNCYNTEEKAKANRDKWIAFYASDEVIEV